MRTILTVLTLSMLACSLSANAFSCNSNLIELGDRDFMVRQHCGEPFWTNRWLEEHIQGSFRSGLRFSEDVHFDEWYLNFGPNRLMRRLLFRNGELIDVDTLGHGVRIDPNRFRCDPQELSTSSHIGEVYARCGPPDHIDRHLGERFVRHGAVGRRVLVTFERWTYDFGSNKFMRIVRFENGRLKDVEITEHRGGFFDN